MAEEKAREFKGPGGRGPRGPKPKLDVYKRQAAKACGKKRGEVLPWR